MVGLIQSLKGIILMVGIMLLTGCKTQAPLIIDSTTDTTTHTDRERDSIAGQVSELSMEFRKFYQSWREKVTDISGTWHRDEFSPPDSLGNQHKTSTTTGSFNSTSKEQQRDTSIVNIDLSAVETKITKVNDKLQQIEKTLTDMQLERKAAISWWQAALMWLGGIFVGIILFKLIWRKLP